MAFRDSINDLMFRFYERFKQNNNRLPVSVDADINVGDVQIGTVKQGAKDDGAEPWDVALQGMDDPEDPVGGTLLGRLSALEEKMDVLLSDGLQLKGSIVAESDLGIDIFDPRTIPEVYAKLGADKGYITDMVSVGKDVYALYANVFLLHSPDEGRTWKVSLAPHTDAEPLYMSFLAVDEAGLEGEPGGVYVMGNRHNTSTNAATAVVWYKAPNSDQWEMRDSGFLIAYGKFGNVSGFAAGKIGLAFVTRNAWVPGDDTTIRRRWVYYSKDRGQTWEYYDLTTSVFANHTHDIWASPFEEVLYVTGGDSYDGLGGCVKTTDFETWEHIYKEVPGYRALPVWGTVRHRMLGVEHAAGAVVLLSTDDKEWEIRFGRCGHEFANFRSLKQSNDGLTVVGTYQYAHFPQAKGQSGTVMLSDDEGITFRRIKVPTQQISALTITPNYVFVGGGWTDQVDQLWPYITRISRTYAQQVPLENKVIKPMHLRPVNATLQQCEIAPGDVSFSTNMSRYSQIRAYIRTRGAGELTIQGRLYDDEDGLDIGGGQWDDLVTRTYSGPTTEWVDLGVYDHYHKFRVKNTGESAISVYEVSLVGNLI